MSQRSRWQWLLALVCIGSAASLGLAMSGGSPPDEVVRAPVRAAVEGVPMCPWRFPERDSRRFFGPGTRYQTQAVVLSGQLLALKRRLGRLPTPEENPLYIHRIYRGDQDIGDVLARRVKGEYGGIEIVVGIGTDGRVRGVEVQRLREPASSAQVLESPAWLALFGGRSSRDGLSTLALEDVPAEARSSARAVVEGVSSLLILQDVARGEERGEHEKRH
jgi:hypothetical protein